MKKDRCNVSEDNSDQENEKELERLIAKSEKLQEKIDKKKGSATRRVRSELFGDCKEIGQEKNIPEMQGPPEKAEIIIEP